MNTEKSSEADLEEQRKQLQLQIQQAEKRIRVAQEKKTQMEKQTGVSNRSVSPAPTVLEPGSRSSEMPARSRIHA